MKRLICSICFLLISASVHAAGIGVMERDQNGVVAQGGAPNGLLSQTLTVYSTTVDATGSLWWALYAPSDCKVRLMPTAAKGAFPQFTAVNGTWTSRIVNRATPFLNFSGCASGELQRQ